MPTAEVNLIIPQPATCPMIRCPHCGGEVQLDQLAIVVKRVNTAPDLRTVSPRERWLDQLTGPQRAALAGIDPLGPAVTTVLAAIPEGARPRNAEKFVIDCIRMAAPSKRLTPDTLDRARRLAKLPAFAPVTVLVSNALAFLIDHDDQLVGIGVLSVSPPVMARVEPTITWAPLRQLCVQAFAPSPSPPPGNGGSR
jgi:hypothetical protein